MTVHSFLNQPFDAEIELLDVGGIPLAEIIVTQASVEDFERVGLERAYAVDLLAFIVEKNAAGKPVVTIRSTERIDDPYLQILVDLAWAKGQVYRDYTILLDPPDYQLTVIKKQTSQAVTRSPISQESKSQPGVIEKSIITQVSGSTDINKQNYGEVTYGPTLAKDVNQHPILTL